eukprot:scaffold319_cov244-Pinguiococcus_pyrenoidosus.AAC.17
MTSYFEVEDPSVPPEFDPAFVERLLHGAGEEDDAQSAAPEAEGGWLQERLLHWSIDASEAK